MRLTHLELAQLCDKSYSDMTVLRVSEVEVLVLADGNCRTLAVRGTDGNNLWPFTFSLQGLRNWRDVFRDMRFIPINVGYGYVHRGFYLSATRWFWKYRSKLERFGPDGKQIEYTLTGHSKGAAEAVQLAILMNSYDYKVVEVTVFAEPKSLYPTARKAFDAMACVATSYINAYDPIRLAPPWGFACNNRTKLKGTPRGHSIRGYIQALLTSYGDEYALRD